MTRRQAVASAVAGGIVGAAGFGAGLLVTNPAPPRPLIGFAAATAPTCLTTMTIPGKPNAKGVVVWKVGTVRPTTTERVCWHRGYEGKP